MSSPETRRAAVWGASGFIGSALCVAAEAKGWIVQRLPRSGADAAALAGVQVAYHCAGSPTGTDPGSYVDAAGRFADACAAVGVQRLVYVSTVAVHGDYAQSRIQAEHRMQESLAGKDTQLCVVRVPTVVGRGMSGRVIRRFARAVGWGVFLHPGPAGATLPCLGVRRLAQILVRLGGLPSAPTVAIFSDHLRWTEIAQRVGESRGRRIVRVPLPALGGKLAALASSIRYQDDSAALFGQQALLPATLEDLDAALRP